MHLKRYAGTVMQHTERETLTAAFSTLKNRQKSRAKCSSYHNGDPSDSMQMRSKFFFVVVPAAAASVAVDIVAVVVV